MAIAAVPDYLGNNFNTASPGLRFGMYLGIWSNAFNKEKNTTDALKTAGKLNDNDKAILKGLLARQQAAFSTAANTLQLDAISVSPFSTGLGNEHPLENGFAFLNPYGLPYLPGSGVKGVLRQAARELGSGTWGDKKGWTVEAITVLFGQDDNNLDASRGTLTFWDVIPQIKGDSLAVEIMTPHQKHYYQDEQSPHDSGQPVPISFLTVPPGSGFTFHVQCNPALLPNGLDWKALLQAAFEHAFNWLGFGAKTAVGYGAMAEDAIKKAERERLLQEHAESARRSTLSPEDLAYEEHSPVIGKFREDFDLARMSPYQAGQDFDSKRNVFIDAAKAWTDDKSRNDAATLLEESIKWGCSKKGKDRLKEAVVQLKGSGA